MASHVQFNLRRPVVTLSLLYSIPCAPRAHPTKEVSRHGQEACH